MHELAIAESILETVASEIETKQIQKVKRIIVSIGVLSGVDKDALQSGFESLEKDLVFFQTKLVVNEHYLTIYCQDCRCETKIIDSFVLRCSKCNKPSKMVLKGNELLIESIEYE